MTHAQTAKLARARKKLTDSPIDELTREQMEHALDCSASATNGAPDKIAALCDAQFASTLAIAHFVADAPGYSDRAARAAVADCPLRAAHADALPVATDAASRVARWAAAVRPIAWPIAVPASIIGAAGHLPTVLDAIRGLFA